MHVTLERSRPHPAGHSLTSIAGLLSAIERLKRSMAIHLTRRELRELPDWILRDIGLSRREIDGLFATARRRHRDSGRHSCRLQP